MDEAIQVELQAWASREPQESVVLFLGALGMEVDAVTELLLMALLA